jgi:hypothetical protein
MRDAQKSERGSIPSPFQQNPISPRPKLTWDITTPGKSKTTLAVLEQARCHALEILIRRLNQLIQQGLVKNCPNQ